MKTVFDHINHISNNFEKIIAVEHGNQFLTYKELNSLSENIKNNLITKYSIRKNEVVGLSMLKSIDTIALILGILKTGAILVFIDIEQPLKRQNYIIETSNCKYLISTGTNIFNNQIKKIEVKTLLTRYEEVNKVIKINPKDSAYIVYTSGTTGYPKGALINHAGLENMAYQQSKGFDMTIKDKLAHFSSYSFDAAIAEIFETFVSGATLVIPTQDNIKTSPIELHKFLTTSNISILTVTPSFLHNLKPEHLKSLRMILVVGEKLPPALVNKFIDYLDIYNSYGVSECSICTTIYKFPRTFDGKVKIGKPIENSNVLILNQNLKEVKVGHIGEIFIGGIGVAKGYVNNVSETEQKFFSLKDYSGVYYKTGDLGSKDVDGSIIFHGRKDDQIKIRGIRIEPKEIEAQLNRISYINNSHVTAIEYDSKCQLVAFIESDKKEIQKPEISSFLKQVVPDYMVPNRIICLQKFPIAIGGKLDKELLYSYFHQETKPKTQNYRDKKDNAIISIFQEILGVKNIETDKDVFNDYGCDSILSLNIIVRIEEELGLQISAKLIYDYPTIDTFIYYAIKQRSKAKFEFNNYILPKEIKAIAASSVKRKKTNRYLVTGATSKLGLEIIKNLINIDNSIVYCLIRADSTMNAKSRILERLFAHNNIATENHYRIVPVKGDVTSEKLGLSNHDYSEITEWVDKVYHVAAEVNHFKTFEELKTTNVEPIKHLVEICSYQRKKRLIFISSCAVFLAAKQIAKQIFNENSNIVFDNLRECSGYSISKFCAEYILGDMKNFGLDYQIHRLDILINEHNQEVSNQWIDILVETCEKSKLAFKNDNLDFTISPKTTSNVAEAVVILSNTNDSNTFHVFPPKRYSISNFLKKKLECYSDIKFIPFDEWCYKIANDKSLITTRVKVLLNILRDIKLTSSPIIIESNATNQLLKLNSFQF